MTPQPPCRIDGLLAEEANQVVLFRRGPSKQVQQLVWDLGSDKITPGQWLGARVYSERSDVTSDGRYVLYTTFGGKALRPNGQRSKGADGMSYTAISRPPYFTALAIWFCSTWDGGGFWESNRRLLIHRFGATDLAVPPYAKIEVASMDWTLPETKSIYANRFRLRGWITLRDDVLASIEPSWRTAADLPFDEGSITQASIASNALAKVCEGIPRWREQLGSVMVKRLKGGFLLREQLKREEEWIAIDDEGNVLRMWKPETPFAPIWVDVDASGQMIFAEHGRLYRWPSFPFGKPQVIADLTPNRFEQVPPPDWALSW